MAQQVFSLLECTHEFEHYAFVGTLHKRFRSGRHESGSIVLHQKRLRGSVFASSHRGSGERMRYVKLNGIDFILSCSTLVRHHPPFQRVNNSTPFCKPHTEVPHISQYSLLKSIHVFELGALEERKLVPECPRVAERTIPRRENPPSPFFDRNASLKGQKGTFPRKVFFGTIRSGQMPKSRGRGARLRTYLCQHGRTRGLTSSTPTSRKCGSKPDLLLDYYRRTH